MASNSSRVVWISLLFLASGTGSCSASSDAAPTTSPTPNVVSTTESTYCEKRDTRVKNCGPDVASGKACAKEYRCVASSFALADTFLDCRANPDCGAINSDESCRKKASDARGTANKDTCYAKRSECEKVGKTFSDDRSCYLLPIANASTSEKIMNCLSLACDQISACIGTLQNEIPDCY